MTFILNIIYHLYCKYNPYLITIMFNYNIYIYIYIYIYIIISYISYISNTLDMTQLIIYDITIIY